MPSQALMRRILPLTLERMGQLAPRLSTKPEGQELEALRMELEELGWLLSVLSTCDGLASVAPRHHPRGLAILLEFALPACPKEALLVPNLSSSPGVPFAWNVAVWLSQTKAPTVRIHQHEAAHRWRFSVEMDSERTTPVLPVWFKEHDVVSGQTGSLCWLDVPAMWLAREPGTMTGADQ